MMMKLPEIVSIKRSSPQIIQKLYRTLSPSKLPFIFSYPCFHTWINDYYSTQKCSARSLQKSASLCQPFALLDCHKTIQSSTTFVENLIRTTVNVFLTILLIHLAISDWLYCLLTTQTHLGSL